MFLFVPSDTFAVGYIVYSRKTYHKKTRKREREFFTTTFIAINLLTVDLRGLISPSVVMFEWIWWEHNKLKG